MRGELAVGHAAPETLTIVHVYQALEALSQPNVSLTTTQKKILAKCFSAKSQIHA